MNKRILFVLCSILILMLACSLPSVNSGGGGEEENGSDDGGGILLGKDEPNPIPVSFNEGLASLDSYHLSLTVNSTGPGTNDSSSFALDSERSKDSDSSYSHINNVSTSEESPDPSSSDNYIYRIGNDRCSGSDSQGWDWQSSTDAERELQEVANRLIGFTPLIEDPEFVGQEEVNGIPTNHFSFSVSGLGARSGAEVRVNEGDYWLAEDGQYLVKYSLVLEMSLEEDAQISREEISLELDDINQPVSVSFPQGCIDASLEPEE